MNGAPNADGLRDPRSPSALCFGETLVDLICPERGVGFEGAEAFVPHRGGAPTNVAATAAALGVDVQIAGGVGDDRWGDWLALRLEREGVGLRYWQRLAGVPTVVAFVVVDAEAVPEFLIYGASLAAISAAFEPQIEAAVEDAGLVVFGSNTMVGEQERSVSLRLREHALARGRGVLFDANLRLASWRDRKLAVSLCRTCCEGAMLVKTNREEVELLTGERDPIAGAEALLALGARNALVTCGADGAVLRGTASVEVDAVPARVVDTTGSGDAMTGALVAALTTGGAEPEALVAGVRLGAVLGARAAEVLGSLSGESLRAALEGAGG